MPLNCFHVTQGVGCWSCESTSLNEDEVLYRPSCFVLHQGDLVVPIDVQPLEHGKASVKHNTELVQSIDTVHIVVHSTYRT